MWINLAIWLNLSLWNSRIKELLVFKQNRLSLLITIAYRVVPNGWLSKVLNVDESGISEW
jgi:hypothetical protein